MKKTLLIALVLTAFAIPVFAGLSQQMKDGANAIVETFAPDPTKSQALSIVRTQVDMRNDITWNVYVSSNCKFRNTSTTTRTGTLQTVTSGGYMRAVHRKYPFVSFSGCTSGELNRQ